RQDKREVGPAERQAVHHGRLAVAVLPALERERRCNRASRADRLAEQELWTGDLRPFSEHARDRLPLGLVGAAQTGGGGPDRADLPRLEAGALDREPHGALDAFSIVAPVADPLGIRRDAV